MTLPVRRHKNLAAICFGIAGIVAVIYGWKGAYRHDELLLAELRAKDQFTIRGRKVAVDTNLVFLGITQPSYSDLIGPEDIAAEPVLAELTNSFPWSRSVWAAVIDKLAHAGAKVIVIDLLFPAPGNGDADLRRVLDRHADRVVIAANAVSRDFAAGQSAGVLYPDESVLNYSNKTALWADGRVGFVNYVAGADDVIRRATFRLGREAGLPPDGELESLVARALRKTGEHKFIPSDFDPHLFRFTARPGEGYPAIPIYELFIPSFWTNNFHNGDAFRGKIVLIGPAANIFHDEHRTPFPGDAMLGPEIHLNVMAAARRGEFLGETSYEMDLISILAAGTLAWLLTFAVRSPVRRLAVAVSVSVLYLFVCRFAFDRANFIMLTVSPLLVLNVSTLGGFTYEFVLERIEKNRTRRTLERYVSKDVVREVLDNPESYLNALGGVRKPITILFSDVRGFTTLTENADEVQLVAQLNEYFNEMVGIIFAEHGSLDKFIGDAVMALWGSITSEGVEQDAQHAVAAAIKMRQALARLNVNWKQRGIQELSFGIGINHGNAIVGNLGSERQNRMEVSAIGDAVNLGSRLESLTKEYKLDLLLGEGMVSLIRERFVLRTVDSVKVKGKTKPVRVFTVVADLETDEQAAPWLARYEEGIEFYRARRFSDGANAFGECSRAAPDDYLSQLYLKRCQELIAHPPGPEWDTVFVMKSK